MKDISEDGQVQFHQFMAWWKAAKPAGGGDIANRLAEAKIRNLFNKFDKDNSGFLDKEEIGSFCGSLGLHLTDEELDEAIDGMDAEGADGSRDHQIDFEVRTPA